MGQTCATKDSTAVRPDVDLDSPSSASHTQRAGHPPMLSREVPNESESPSAAIQPPPAKLVVLPTSQGRIDAIDANVYVEEFEGPITPARPAPPQLIDGWLSDILSFKDVIDTTNDKELLGRASTDIIEPSENGFIYTMQGPTTPTRPANPATLLNFFAAALR